MEQLYTRWGRTLEDECVWQEYPRPLLERDSYVNLNGMWEYHFTDSFQKPEQYEGKIRVPFSPESVLSGVGRQLQPEEYLWYRRAISVQLEKLEQGNRLLLHFGAVDQSCRVYLNGREVLRHTGGYLPFEGDVTEAVDPEKEEQELIVVVKDLSDTSYHSRGKQKLQRGGMFYTAQSGIWQTVWMEYVPGQYVEKLTIEPDPDRKTVGITVQSEANVPVEIQILKPAIYEETEAETFSAEMKPGSEVLCSVKGRTGKMTEVSLPEVCPWTCEQPWLYYVIVRMGKDCVRSYFALRSFTVEMDEKGIPRICLNHQPQFQRGVLDQGYWPDGLYTAPCDEAFLFDIQSMKDLGYNMIRKHIKIEPSRWYYHCDRLGMVVWQDMVNGGAYYKHWFVTYVATLLSWWKIRLRDVYTHLLARKDREGRLEFVSEMKATVECLKGHPSIAVWVIFNEGWGQFQTKDMTEMLRKMDKTRLIDQASGWFDQGSGDFQSLHNYFFPLHIKAEKKRATVLSEYGGYSMQIDGHTACQAEYGYGTHRNTDSLNKAYEKRWKAVQALEAEGMCASVYTQLSDVEEEVNGIFTYDREVQKISNKQQGGEGK